MPPAQPEAPEAKDVQGKIKTMDASGKSVTLEDGTKLTIPDPLKSARVSLKRRAIVRETYQEMGGNKVVTSIEVLRQEKKPKS